MRNYIKPSSKQKGFALIELLVTSFLGLILLSMISATMLMNRSVLGRDTSRTRLNQNLRGSMDIIGFDTRVSGENLPSTFPAILLTTGTTDTFTVRRNLVDEVLNLCVQINSGSTTTQIKFAIPGTVAGCVYSNMTTAYNSWNTYRTNNGGTVDAFIWDRVNKRGEFFKFSANGTDGTSYWLTRTAGTWANTYTLGTSNIYILEEWQYRLVGDTLQVVQDQDTTNPLNVSFGITDFQVSILKSDGTTVTSFTTSDNWPDISQVNISISGKERYSGKDITRTMSGRFFPRNILSF
jgi:prepilin-type N-terminal cleavage/methylation domain-containing protein